MAYRKFDTGAWQDPWFESLSPQAKLLFIYLWTNDVCNQAGLYEISKRRMEFEVGFNVDEVMKELDSKVFWDAEKNIIWVKSFFKWQCQNDSFAIGALKQIEDSPYFKEYLVYNTDLLKKYDKIWRKYMVAAGSDDNCTPSEHHADRVPTPSEDHVSTVPTPSKHHDNTNPASEQNRTETEQKDTYCSEQKICSELEVTQDSNSDVSKQNPVISIPLVKSAGEYPVSQEDIDSWQETYTGIDVLYELKQYREWALSNPKKRKTAKGIRASLVYWLSRAQDRCGSGKGGGDPSKSAARKAEKKEAIENLKRLPDDQLKILSGAGNMAAGEILKFRGKAMTD